MFIFPWTKLLNIHINVKYFALLSKQSFPYNPSRIVFKSIPKNLDGKIVSKAMQMFFFDRFNVYKRTKYENLKMIFFV